MSLAEPSVPADEQRRALGGSDASLSGGDGAGPSNQGPALTLSHEYVTSSLDVP